MDINQLRSIVTLLSFVMFLGIVFWAYRKRNAARFEQDAHLVFLGEPPESTVAAAVHTNSNEG